MFDQATLDAIKAAATEEGGILLRPHFADGPAFQAYWQRSAGGASHNAWGTSEGDALDNLLLMMQGKAAEVKKSLRLQAAQMAESEAQAVLDAAVAERTAIERE